jgi:hypothetical protein
VVVENAAIGGSSNTMSSREVGPEVAGGFGKFDQLCEFMASGANSAHGRAIGFAEGRQNGLSNQPPPLIVTCVPVRWHTIPLTGGPS